MTWIILAVAIWLIAARLAPITIWREVEGANARNWPGLVVIGPDIDQPAAVWAQEAYEARRKLLRVWELPFLLLGRVRPSWDAVGRDMELTGHEIEAVVASWHYGLDHDTYRAKEAATLGGAYAGLAGWPPEEIERAMREKSLRAMIWAAAHRNRIATVKHIQRERATR